MVRSLGRVDLLGPEGEVVLLRAADLVVVAMSEEVRSVWLVAACAVAEWEGVAGRCWLGLRDEPLIFGGRFDRRRGPVRLELQLRSDLLPLVSALIEDEDDLERVARLNALATTDAWALWTATQLGPGGVRVGLAVSCSAAVGPDAPGPASRS